MFEDDDTNRQPPRPVVSVVLPCLDEVDSVGLCVTEALEAMSGAGIIGEVVVVDNGSTDGSERVAAAHGAVIVRQPCRGYGNALLAGIEAARGEVVVMADADFTYDLSKIPQLVQPVLDGDADLVLGSRVNGATRQTMPFLHRFVGTPAITFLISRACGGTVVKDSQSGYRAFRREAVNELHLRSGGMEFASEMLIRAARARLRIQEIDAGYRPRIGTSKLDTFSDGWRHLQLVLSLAPDLLLVGPGIALACLGLFLSVLGLFSPTGVELGSLQWQPVFFSTIALVLGTQAVLAGAVLAYRLAAISGRDCSWFGFVGRPAFPRTCLKAGTAAGLAGLALDGALFATWISQGPTPSRALALAALAQSLLIVGASLVTFGIVAPIVLERCEDVRQPAVVVALDPALPECVAMATMGGDHRVAAASAVPPPS